MATTATCDPLIDRSSCLADRAAIAGLTMKVAASLLSLGSLLYMFCFVVYSHRRTLTTGIHIFYNDMDLLIFSLFCADFVLAISGLLNLKWILDGVVEVGSFCDVQGILTVIGETGIAISTLVVAIYTFVVISTGTSRGFPSMRIAVATVVGIWVVIVLPVVVGYSSNHGPSKPSFMSPTPYSCWVSADYLTWRIVSEYIWLWITLFGLPILYIPLYLWMRGNLVFRNSIWYRWSLQSSKFSDPNLRPAHRSAWVMLLYLVVCSACILPSSFVRWIAFVQEGKYGTNSIPPAAIFAAMTIFNLSGFFNVILVITTKPNLGLFGQQDLGRPPSS